MAAAIKKKKIYVAGKWNDKDKIQRYISIFEANNFTITHNWTKVESSSNYTYDEKGVFADQDLKGVTDAEYLVICITDEKYPYRGTCTELGAALAKGKRVFVLDPFPKSAFSENIFTNHPLVHWFASFNIMLKNFDKKCSICGYAPGNNKKCTDCGDIICRTCEIRNSHSLDGLFVSTHCVACDSLICPACVKICYKCFNENNTSGYCIECKPSTMIDNNCFIHGWSLCQAHQTGVQLDHCSHCNYDIHHC
jgi:nucleoside 2-deoxyribosyltransferase